MTPAECLAIAVAYLVQDDERDPRTLQRLVDEMARFVATLELNDICEISAADPDDVDSYIKGAALGPNGIHRRPSPSTISHRRTAVREFYAIGRSLGFASGDPTLDLRVPRRPSRVARPLTEVEMRTVRAVARGQFVTARNPAMVALAEAGATNSELGAVRIMDVDLTARIVHLPGSRRSRPRVNPLDEPGAEAIQQRLTAMGNTDPEQPLLVDPTSIRDAAAASISNALVEVLRYSGLGSDPRVKPDSIRAGAARRLHEETGHIEDVVRFLGLRSLDAAACLIGYEWDVPRRSGAS